ncbi:hypothetical protein B6D29_03110 [Microgenomates bacterium UTCPR1]|nr:MAG: hypothetical protein B6D29_03110 [Microgenomates bacterium UTCPR1]
MKKSVIWIDLGLLFVFIINILSNFIHFPFKQILQPIFFILIIIHVAQHWRIIITMIKNLFR